MLVSFFCCWAEKSSHPVVGSIVYW